MVGVGGLKFHWVPHSTVLFGAQISAKGPVLGAMTVNFNWHDAELPAQSKTETVKG